ncbi:protein YgfX [Massilia niabensis]|uniref:protein YgfX n=1 Tax=Massilia niabensis TaxID=544910 RepID=UPI0036D339D0
MSLAVSALVAPSRSLRTMLALFALANIGAAVAVAVVLPERFAGAQLCAVFFLLAGLISLHGCVSATKTHQIDVSGTGAIRLTVQQEMGADTLASSGIVVMLLPETLVWSQLLLLHLGDAHGKRTVVPVLRDSLARPEYRALRVALGGLCGRGSPAATTNEIL